MRLFICEKPSQARDIAKILGATQRHDGYLEGNKIQVTWCLGHLLELAPPDEYCPNIKPWRMEILPIVPDEWKLIPVTKTKKQFNVIKKLLKKANHVVIATDADREGDVIGRELLDYVGFDGKVERLWLSALDDASIKKSLNDIRPGKSTENLYQAGLGRQRADWLIGMCMTIGVSALFGKKGEGVLSVGRVQTPTLNLVVERDRTIENFTPTAYFELYVEFVTKNNETAKLKWQPTNENPNPDGSHHCLHRDTIETIARRIDQQTGNITQFTDKKKTKRPPLCLSLSNLQKIASSQQGLSAKKTLETAQSLYETHKATTYPRTDCGYLPESQLKDASVILELLTSIDPSLKSTIELCDLSYRSSVWNDKKITAHHGIIPTLNKRVEVNKMSDTERKVYDLICRYYIAQFLGDYEYASRSVQLSCCDELFKATTNTPLKSGWKRAFANESNDGTDEKQSETDGEPFGILPTLCEGETLTHQQSDIKTKQTKAPARFTEGTLITTMKSISNHVEDDIYGRVLKETAGIGTEATRANILELLVKRGFMQRKGKQLISTPKGRELMDKLPDIIKDPIVTGHWEQMLDDMAEGKVKLDEFICDQVDMLEGMLGCL